MRVGLHTVDLFPGRERLMPFRTVLEVARVMRLQGWDADVLNSSVSEVDAKDFEWQGVKVVQCPRNFGELSRWVNAHGYDAFVFAATIREGLKPLNGFKLMKCRKIAYIPSGITPVRNALWLLKRHGGYAKAWVLEALTPKGLIGRKLKNAGFTDIIGMTGFTTRLTQGVIKGHTIYPGKDDFEKIESDESVVCKYGLKGERFYLFTGGPAPSRGGEELLLAFDRMADEVPDAKLVFIVRHDVGGKYEALYRVLNGLKHKDNVVVIKDKLSVNQLKAFFGESYAVVLPFICIPAEIPITYYEVMSCGTPVISFPNSGTTEYLGDGIKLCNGVSIGAMKTALCSLWNNTKERDTKGIAAMQIMKSHPNWQQVGLQWINVINNNYR